MQTTSVLERPREVRPVDDAAAQADSELFKPRGSAHGRSSRYGMAHANPAGLASGKREMPVADSPIYEACI
jgi:hypothetical protein